MGGFGGYIPRRGYMDMIAGSENSPVLSNQTSAAPIPPVGIAPPGPGYLAPIAGPNIGPDLGGGMPPELTQPANAFRSIPPPAPITPRPMPVAPARPMPPIGAANPRPNSIVQPNLRTGGVGAANPRPGQTPRARRRAGYGGGMF